MSSVSGFALLACGDQLNLSTKLTVRTKKEKSNEAANRKLEKYREHFRTSQVNVPPTNVKDLGMLLERLSFKQPTKYIEYIGSAKDDKVVEYDVDEEDCEWIATCNRVRAEESVKEISVEKFEIAIDRIEKCCKFEASCATAGASSAQQNAEDVDDVCCVCGDGDVSNANQIIYCDMCNIAVHQDCYGVPYIPEGSWLCRRCKLSPSVPVSCCLCPYKFGAFKPTSDGRWAHVVCAIWLNEVHFGNAVFLEPIEGVKETLKLRKSLRCLYCRQKQGACLQCSSRSCIKAFHVTCAQQLGLAMKVETVLDQKDGEEVDVKRFVYCQKHESGNNMSKKEIEMSIRKARRNMEASGAYKPTVNMPSITRKNVDRIAKETGIENFEDVVVYWYQKRRSRAGVPLIKRLNVEIVPKEKRTVAVDYGISQEDKAICDKFRIVRNSLETARLLSEQVKKREMHKRMLLNLSKRIFESSLAPIDDILTDIVSQMEEKDSKFVFASPVELEGYTSIIKNPMDLSTMRKKIRRHKYASVSDLRKDVLLMTDNCSKFNHDNEYYLKYGKRFRKAALLILEEGEKRFKESEQVQNRSDAKFWEQLEKEFAEGMAEEEEVVNEKVGKSGGKNAKKAKLDTSVATTPIHSEPATQKKGKGRVVRGGETPASPIVMAKSPLEQDEQMEDDDPIVTVATSPSPAKPMKNAWSFLNSAPTPTSNKRRNANGAATTPKRKKEMVGQSILPFLATTSKDSQPLAFASFATKGNSPNILSMSSGRTSRSSKTNGPTFSTSFRETSSVRSPLPADTASSTEYSTDEDIIENEIIQKKSKKECAKSKKVPKYRVSDTPIEKAKNEMKSIFAHNAIVNVDGKAAKVIDMQYAHLSDITRDQRQHMLNSRPSRISTPSNSKNGSKMTFSSDDKQLLYVEFFQKTSSSDQYKWVSPERCSLLDFSNTGKSKIVGLKAAREWQQSILKQ